jgi:hypothetical protein
MCRNASRIVGPVCFNEIVNCKRYVQAIFMQFFPQLTQEERLYGWFQQESAVIFGQHIHWFLILMIVLLGLFEGQFTAVTPKGRGTR